MVTQRTEGLYRLFLLCQLVIVALLFWSGVWIMVTFYSPGPDLDFTWRRYSIYCGLIVLGIWLESLSRSGSKNYLLQNELLQQHRLSLRSEEHTSELQSRGHLVCRLLLEKKKTNEYTVWNRQLRVNATYWLRL